jgi:hypothetical protein
VTLAPKGLLIEEQRTNLLTYSEQFDNAVWAKINTTVTANATVAPDGTSTAEQISFLGTTEGTVTQNTGASVSGVTYVFSIWLRADSPQTVTLRFRSTVTQSASVTTSWQRFTFVRTAADTNEHFIGIASGDTSAKTVFAWGAQLEVGAFQTSYVPSVASQVTRAADNASMIGNNFARWYNVNEGSLYLDSVNQNGAQAIVALGRGTFATNIAFNITNLIRSAGTTPTLTVGTAVAAPVRLAAALKPGDFAASANGAAAVTDSTNLTIQNQANQLQIGNNAGGNVLNGTISRISYYPRRLANTELVALTS